MNRTHIADATIAYERGRKDAVNYVYRLNAGEHGPYHRDNYPSNPYNESADHELWAAYNKGWNSAAF